MSTRTVTRTATYKFDLRAEPFRDHETLSMYATRRLAERGVVGAITRLDAWADIETVELKNAAGVCDVRTTVAREILSATVEEDLTVPS